MKKALVVGINNYASCPLYGCINDAMDVESAISRNGDGTVNFSVKPLFDVTTKGILRNAIEECFAGDADIALFYFSGHGYIDSVGGYIVTPDFTPGDYGISMQELLTIVNNSKCKNKVVVLDCCHSGMMGNMSIGNQNTAVISEGVTLLTASKRDETSAEVNGHGVFTSLFIDALNGGAADLLGNITLGGIYAFVDKSLGPWDQRPVFKTNVTSFSPIKTVVPPVSLDVLRFIGELFTNPDENYALNPSFEPTNDPNVKHDIIEPYANQSNTEMFKKIQKLESVGIIVPNGTPHMYYAAMESKSCRLTATGKYYWSLLKKNLI